MRHIIALIIKFTITGVILELTLRFLTSVSSMNIFLIALLFTLISYGLGDLIILNKTNNIIATIADGVLAFLILFASNYIFRYTIISLKTVLIASVILGIEEWIYHKYVRMAVFPPNQRT